MRRWKIDDKYQATIKSFAVHRYQSEVKAPGNHQFEVRYFTRAAV
nr:MAG TPA: hypothetical protein [Caudoviricetes sp.]